MNMGRKKRDPNLTKLQQVSDVAWLVKQGNNKLGILNKDVQEKYVYITGKELLKFEDETEAMHKASVKDPLQQEDVVDDDAQNVR